MYVCKPTVNMKITTKLSIIATMCVCIKVHKHLHESANRENNITFK